MHLLLVCALGGCDSEIGKNTVDLVSLSRHAHIVGYPFLVERTNSVLDTVVGLVIDPVLSLCRIQLCNSGHTLREGIISGCVVLQNSKRIGKALHSSAPLSRFLGDLYVFGRRVAVLRSDIILGLTHRHTARQQIQILGVRGLVLCLLIHPLDRLDLLRGAFDLLGCKSVVGKVRLKGLTLKTTLHRRIYRRPLLLLVRRVLCLLLLARVIGGHGRGILFRLFLRKVTGAPQIVGQGLGIRAAHAKRLLHVIGTHRVAVGGGRIGLRLVAFKILRVGTGIFRIRRLLGSPRNRNRALTRCPRRRTAVVTDTRARKSRPCHSLRTLSVGSKRTVIIVIGSPHRLRIVLLRIRAEILQKLTVSHRTRCTAPHRNIRNLI